MGRVTSVSTPTPLAPWAPNCLVRCQHASLVLQPALSTLLLLMPPTLSDCCGCHHHPATDCLPPARSDAGDYGKYVINSGTLVGWLMASLEVLGAENDDLPLPEAGDGIPDILQVGS